MIRRADVGSLGTILGVWAHPDDEVYLSGGLMTQACANGQRVAVLTATRGELGTTDPEEWPPGRLALRRQAELEISLSTLGVREHWLLDHPDGGCDRVPVEIGAGQVAAVIDAIHPDTILTFGPEGYTGHGDHRAMSAWVDAAVAFTGSNARILHATADSRFLTRWADLHERFDVFFAGKPSVTARREMALHLRLRGETLDRKLAALRAQSSQTAHLIRTVGVGRYRRWVSQESFLDAAHPYAGFLTGAAA